MSAYIYQPAEVSLETQALCNAACTFCPYPTLERKGVRMTDDLVQSLVTQMSDFTMPFYVSPFKVNEPFLDDRLERICLDVLERCPAATLRLFTNGQPLTRATLEWIARLERVAHLWVSLNDYDAERYGALMGLSLSITLRRLDALHDYTDFPHDVIVSRVCDGTPHDAGFVSFVSARWPLFRPQLIKRDGWLGYVAPTSTRIPMTPCARWWELSVMATGRVALCCMDGTGAYAIGDATTTPLLEIYNQPALVARRTSQTRRFDIEPCNRCTY